MKVWGIFRLFNRMSYAIDLAGKDHVENLRLIIFEYIFHKDHVENWLVRWVCYWFLTPSDIDGQVAFWTYSLSLSGILSFYLPAKPNDAFFIE